CTRGGASVAGLTSAHNRGRLPVIVFEESIDPLLGAAGIFIDREGDVYRRGKFTEITPGFLDNRPYLTPLLAPPGEARLIGEPAVEMPGRPLEGRSDRPSHPDRRAAPGVRDGAGRAALHPPPPPPLSH